MYKSVQSFQSKVFSFFLYGVVVLVISGLSTSCEDGQKENQQNESSQKKDSLATIQNPVLPGDFADPSVVRVGDDYWATATSSEWAPLFPLLHSQDLQNWEIVGHVFPQDLPDWAEAHFWAPEIAYDNGTYYIYYTAKKKGGPLCVGVASSNNPKGPYKDHGPLVCQEAGAIDGFQIRDDQGKLYLIWKEDGNSRGEPTPMWGQEMNEERTELVGEKFELFRNDPQTWEGNLVEGAFLIKKNGYYYAFYSGDACCGRGCTYGIGVARAKELRGPWKKYEQNPLKKENDQWKCAGHGSLVQNSDGRYFFLYHAYNKEGNVYTGRQGLLSEVVWGEDGWPSFRGGKAVEIGSNNEREVEDIHVEFNQDSLSNYWQWPVGNQPQFEIENEALHLQAQPEKLGAVLAQRTLSPNYTAMVVVAPGEADLNSGLAAIGDQENALGISVSGNTVRVWKLEKNQREEVATAHFSNAEALHLRMQVAQGEQYQFSWSEDGKNWKDFGAEAVLNGYFLPPWDRAVRVGLISRGDGSSKGRFESFEVDF